MNAKLRSWTAACMLLVAAQAGAETVEMKVSLAKPLLLAGEPQTGYLKVGMLGTGFGEERRRATVNVAIVIDRSGSMSGRKLQQAKEAAIQAISRLSPDDIVAVVAFDDTVSVLLPATRASDKAEIYRAIRSLHAGNTTALFAGVSRGAQEVRKFLSRNFANRVILLSDGLANVGPSSTEALADLGASLRKEGISVTTLGLGLDYNEDLLYHLAKASDGNHAFVESSSDLARIFGCEFSDVLSVAATDVVVRITLAPGFRPIRLLGRGGDIIGQTVVVKLNQLLGKQEKYLLLEFEAPSRREGEELQLADIQAEFNTVTGSRASLSRQVAARYSAARAEVEKAVDREVMVAAVEQIANERNKQAMELRDRGLIEEARAALEENERFLSENASRFKAEHLKEIGKRNRADADNLDGERWNKQRKDMRRYQYYFESQQSY